METQNCTIHRTRKMILTLFPEGDSFLHVAVGKGVSSEWKFHRLSKEEGLMALEVISLAKEREEANQRKKIKLIDGKFLVS